MRSVPVASISLGRWLGMPTRLHVSFLVVAGFALFVASRPPLFDKTAHALLLALVWFSCVALHEAGHCIAVVRLGGATETIVLTPLGGVSEHKYLHEPQRQLAAAFAGPLASLAGCLATGALLLALGDTNIVSLLNPLGPTGLFAADTQVAVIALRMAFWLNWVLLIVNMLPAAPLDASWALCSLIWPAIGTRRAAIVVRRVSLLVMLALCVVAWWLSRQQTGVLIPPWLPLLGLVVMTWCYLPSYPENERGDVDEEDFLGYDFSQGYASLEASVEQRPAAARPSALRRWLAQRRAARETRRIRVEQEEERQVDSILARLHENGLASLSSEDRALLNRVSARYRTRQRN